jgi:hypothetical protein
VHAFTLADAWAPATKCPQPLADTAEVQEAENQPFVAGVPDSRPNAASNSSNSPDSETSFLSARLNDSRVIARLGSREQCVGNSWRDRRHTLLADTPGWPDSRGAFPGEASTSII